MMTRIWKVTCLVEDSFESHVMIADRIAVLDRSLGSSTWNKFKLRDVVTEIEFEEDKENFDILKYFVLRGLEKFPGVVLLYEKERFGTRLPHGYRFSDFAQIRSGTLEIHLLRAEDEVKRLRDFKSLN